MSCCCRMRNELAPGRRGLFAIALAAAVCVTAAGCAPPPPAEETDTSAPARWECSLTGQASPLPDDLGPDWKQDGASFVSVHSTAPKPGGEPGRAGRSEALTDAVTSAADAALNLLDQRGVGFGPERRRAIAEAAARAAATDREVVFPRFRIVGTRWEECVRRADPLRPTEAPGGADAPEHSQVPSAALADTVWKASVLVEYPIGHLRGDANNVLWERSRALSEAEVLLASAEERLRTGHWMAALYERARAVEVIEATGAVFPPGPPYRGEGTPRESELDERMRLASATVGLIADALTSLSARPTARVEVVETRTRADVAAEFLFNYGWTGRETPAAGVPVRFSMPGAGAILRPEPQTDESGIARCVIVSAHAGPGEYLLTVEPDMSVIRTVDPSLDWPYTVDEDPGTAADRASSAASAAMVVYLVDDAHAVSLCLDFDAANRADAAQFVAGFRRRAESDGFLIEECDASVDIVLEGRVSMESGVRYDDAADGVWVARVKATASAFDQRSATDLGEAAVSATERSEEGPREAEVIALKEAGRLLAIYFGSRILLQEG